MKKGFTLVELIAVIAILCIILGISVPMLINSLSTKKETAKEEVLTIIKMAAKGYVIDNDISYPATVTITNMCNTNYLECPIIDPTTNEEIDGYVTINVNGEAVFVSE